MNKLDKDQNGTLDWSEFKYYMKAEQYAQDTFTNLSKYMLSDK